MVSTPTIRQLARVVPPGVDDPSIRQPYVWQPYLDRIIRDLRTVEGVNTVSLHSTSTGGHQEWLIDCDVDHGGVALRLGGKRYEELNHPDEISGVAAALAIRVAHHLPNAFGVEVAAYDPLAIGQTPVPTSRLLWAGDGVPALEQETNPPIADWVTSLATNQVPHLLEIDADVSSPTGPLPTDVRAATFGQGERPSTHAEFASFFEGRTDLGARFADTGIVSSATLPQIHDWSVTDAVDDEPTTADQVLGCGDSLPDTANPQQSLLPLRAPEEYRQLLGLSAENLDQTYRELNCAPSLPVPESTLPTVAHLPINYDVANPWPDCDGRDEPLIRTLFLVREATGTDQHLDDPPHPAAASPSTTVDWDVLNPDLTRISLRYFYQQGEQIEPRQNGWRAIAFDRIPKTGPPSPVVIGSRESLSAGMLISCAATATMSGRPLTVCTPSTADAHWAATVLSRPIAGTDGAWAGLYPISGWCIRRGDTIPVVLEASGPLQWAIHRDRTIALACDGHIIARGPASDPIAVVEDELLHYHIPTQELRLPDGECLEPAVSPPELDARAQPVPWPAVMSQLSHLGSTNILERDRGTLVPTSLTATWDSPRLQRRNEGAATTFLGQFTQREPGRTIPLSDAEPRFRRWIYRQTTLAPPAPEKTARILREANGTQAPTESATSLTDRSWQYPVDLEPFSPEETTTLRHCEDPAASSPLVTAIEGHRKNNQTQ